MDVIMIFGPSLRRPELAAELVASLRKKGIYPNFVIGESAAELAKYTAQLPGDGPFQGCSILFEHVLGGQNCEGMTKERAQRWLNQLGMETLGQLRQMGLGEDEIPKLNLSAALNEGSGTLQVTWAEVERNQVLVHAQAIEKAYHKIAA